MSEPTAAAAAAYADAAQVDAEEAAAHAQVSVHEVAMADLQDASGLVAHLWGPQGDADSQLLRAVLHAGNSALVATQGGRPVGGSLGFLGWDEGVHLHSYGAAVLEGHRSHGVGFALKLTQRAICLRQGVREIRWIFDPMRARNAHFNVVKLGARVRAFRPGFYIADQMDRVEVTWALDAPVGARRQPGSSSDDHLTALVPVPPDILALDDQDPVTAQEIRRTSTDRFGQLFRDGWSPTWVEGGWRFSPPANP
ncbi:MAG: GNAT family N-acetyltransferase [Lapillicoccus sp.]